MVATSVLLFDLVLVFIFVFYFEEYVKRVVKYMCN